ncbi:MAG: glycosyltransferase [Pelagibacterales bacterium]|nr:glycosyltransferase [Pelagibacterales bacterium]
MKTYKILIPVFNDWESLLILLNNIHALKINNLARIKILIIDDCSSEILNKKIEFDSFEDIEIIKNIKNIGHGKSIANSINYLSKKNDFDYLIVMDGDGEDRPEEVKELILKSIDLPFVTITANRIKRSESTFFKLSYHLHKILTLVLTGYSIKFGNFMCIPKKDLNLITSNKNLFASFSGTVAKFIINKTCIPSIRGVRYCGPTKMSFLKLIRHSLLIISVFRKETAIRLSILFSIYTTLIFYFLKNAFLLFILPLAIINILIIFTLFVLYKKNSS